MGFYIISIGGGGTCNSATPANKFCGHAFSTDGKSATLANIPICGNTDIYEYVIKLQLLGFNLTLMKFSKYNKIKNSYV